MKQRPPGHRKPAALCAGHQAWLGGAGEWTGLGWEGRRGWREGEKGSSDGGRGGRKEGWVNLLKT